MRRAVLRTMGRFQAEKLLNMKGTKVRCEITRGTKMVCTYWEPVRAQHLLSLSPLFSTCLSFRYGIYITTVSQS